MIIMAAGWILAAFLGGYLIGRSRDAPKRQMAKTENKAEMTAAETAKAEKAVREWRNFLNYDGTAQEPTE